MNSSIEAYNKRFTRRDFLIATGGAVLGAVGLKAAEQASRLMDTEVTGEVLAENLETSGDFSEIVEVGEEELNQLQQEYGVHIGREGESYIPHNDSIREKLKQAGYQEIQGRRLHETEYRELRYFLEKFPYASKLVNNIVITTIPFSKGLFTGKEEDMEDKDFFNGFFDFNLQESNLYVFTPECITGEKEKVCLYQDGVKSIISGALFGSSEETYQNVLRGVLHHEFGHAIELKGIRDSVQKDVFLEKAYLETGDPKINPVLSSFYALRRMVFGTTGIVDTIARYGKIQRSNVIYEYFNGDTVKISAADGSWSLHTALLDHFIDRRVANFQDIPTDQLKQFSARTILAVGRESWADFWMHYHLGNRPFHKEYESVEEFITFVHSNLLEGKQLFE